MIELLRKEKENEFLDFCNRSVNGAVIYTRLKAYGINSNDVLFWFSENENKNINGVYSLMDGIFTFDADKTADTEEIMMFASVMGTKTITVSGKYILIYDRKTKKGTAEDITGENLKDIFPVIYEDTPNQRNCFPQWYTDTSHKIRHGLIHGKGVFIGGKCVSVALTSGESEKTAVISSVATLKDHRKQGHGENAVISLAASLNKTVYLMTDDEHIAQWYKKIGFKNNSTLR